jgi:hypothetical protein
VVAIDEDDDGCLTCIRSIRSYFGSWLMHLLPGDRSLEFACAGAAPPGTISPATTNIDTGLLVLKDNVATYPPRTLLLLISVMLASS